MRKLVGFVFVLFTVLSVNWFVNECGAQETYDFDLVWFDSIDRQPNYVDWCWEVAPWSNPESPGIAWSTDLTIHYQLSSTAQVDSFTLSDTLDTIEHLVCCNIGGNPGVLAGIRGELHPTGGMFNEYASNYYLAVIQLSPFSIESFKAVGSRLEQEYSTESQSWTRAISQLEVWPPLPAATQYAVYTLRYRFYGVFGMGDQSETVNGTIHALSIPDTTDIPLGSGTEFSIFSSTDSCRLAVFDREYDYSYYQGEYNYSTNEWSYCVQPLPGAIEPRISRDSFAGVVAQLDYSGLSRMVHHGGYYNPSTIIDAESGNALWFFDDGYSPSITAVCDGSLNERFLYLNEWESPFAEYGVLNAANGDSMGAIHFAGRIEKVFHREDAYDLVLVKVEYPTHYYFRLYRNTADYQPHPNFDLSLTRLPGNMLQLSWLPIENADNYEIRYMESYNNIWVFMHELPGTSYTFPMPESRTRMYKVVAHY